MRCTLIGASALCLFMAGAAAAAPADQPGHRSPAPGSRSEPVSALEDGTAKLVGEVSAEMTTTTKGFVDAAAIDDLYEVEAGHIAVRRAQSASVRDFARQMVKAHAETAARLKSIIAANHIAVTPPAHLDDRRQGMIDNLRGAKAADFDHRYLVQQIAAHREAEILMRGYAKDGDNPAIRNFTAATLRTVQDHLTMAEARENVRQSAANQPTTYNGVVSSDKVGQK